MGDTFDAYVLDLAGAVAESRSPDWRAAGQILAGRVRGRVVIEIGR
jgi:hypothetical protein